MSQPIDSELVAAASTRIIEYLQGDGDDVFDDILQVVLETLRSPVGFCGYIDSADGALVCASMTAGVFEQCEVNGKSIRFPQESWGGLWGRVLSERRPLFLNDEHRVPPGHLAIERSLGVPLLCGENLIGSIHIANRGEDYDERDARTLELIAKPVAPAMQARLAHFRQSERAEQFRRDLERQISDERRAHDESQRSLRDLERMHRAILDGTPAVIYAKGVDGGYKFLNKRFEELFHVSREQFLGHNDFEIFPEEQAAAFKKNDELVAQSGEVLTAREEAEQNGKKHTYLSVKFPLKDEAGETSAVAGISIDITDKVEMEHRLAQMSRQSEIILDAIADGVFGMDCEGLATFVNPQAQRLLGWTASELHGQPIQDRIGVQVAPLCEIDELAAEVLIEDDEAFFQTKQGVLLPVRYLARPLVVEDRQVGTVVTFRDLTEEYAQRERDEERQRIERENFEAERQLRSVREMQVELFPPADPVIAGFEIAGRNYPHETVSGDFFDYIPRPDGSLVVVVGDAAGHDLGAAVKMVEAHAVLHTLLDCGVPLEDMITQLNETLCRHLNGRFVSLFVLRLEPTTGKIEFAGAGHDATLLRALRSRRATRQHGTRAGTGEEGQAADFRHSDPGTGRHGAADDRWISGSNERGGQIVWSQTDHRCRKDGP